MKKIAIVGSGIAGLTCAYYLAPHYDVVVFEAENEIGGHTHTVDVEWQGEESAIDTGFIVFNDRTYPNFIRLLETLGVAYQKTEMSFSVNNAAIGLEYNGHSIDSLFAQRKNLLSPSFWRMLRDIVVFNRDVRRKADVESTIGDYLDHTSFGPLFRENYLLPMIAAIWSMGLEDCRDFPLPFFVRFFENHGLLNIVDRPQWYSIVGGSRSYLAPLTESFRDKIEAATPVKRLDPVAGGVRLLTEKDDCAFDEVVLACHADQALELMARPTVVLQQVLGAMPFNDNRVILHTDTTLLPQCRKAWASWNYRVNAEETKLPTLTYNMNILQQLKKTATYLVTLNDTVDDGHVIQRFHYSHPMYNRATIAAQERWHELSGTDHLHFCGAYWFNGFHEDGVRSALRVCAALGVTP